MNYNAESLSAWEANSAWWDDGVGRDGNKYWTRLQEPSLRRMLASHVVVADTNNPDGGRRGSSQALDLATGNGLTARWLVNNGCGSVLATDGVAGQLERARKRGATPAERDRIEYQQLDVTDYDALLDVLKDPKKVKPVIHKWRFLKHAC
jgi:hypothetical protein